MTDKSDDIKQLFSHLGLDANVYQEMRTASRPSVTLTETPRRWSLLQSVAQPPAVTPIAPAPPTDPQSVVTPPVVAPAAAAQSVPPAPASPTPGRLNPAAFMPAAGGDPVTAPRAPAAGSLLPAALAGVHRREPATPLWPSATAAPAATTLSASTPGRMSADESLRLLFQAVREPGPSAESSSADGYEATPPGVIVQPMVPADDAPATAAMPIPSGVGEVAARMPTTHGHNRPTRNRLPVASGIAQEETPPVEAPRALPSNVVAPGSGAVSGESLGALFERLRGLPEAPGSAPGRLRLNVPKAP